jgi:hypothetical protein
MPPPSPRKPLAQSVTQAPGENQPLLAPGRWIVGARP